MKKIILLIAGICFLLPAFATSMFWIRLSTDYGRSRNILLDRNGKAEGERIPLLRSMRHYIVIIGDWADYCHSIEVRSYKRDGSFIRAYTIPGARLFRRVEQNRVPGTDIDRGIGQVGFGLGTEEIHSAAGRVEIELKYNLQIERQIIRCEMLDRGIIEKMEWMPVRTSTTDFSTVTGVPMEQRIGTGRHFYLPAGKTYGIRLTGKFPKTTLLSAYNSADGLVMNTRVFGGREVKWMQANENKIEIVFTIEEKVCSKSVPFYHRGTTFMQYPMTMTSYNLGSRMHDQQWVRITDVEDNNRTALVDGSIGGLTQDWGSYLNYGFTENFLPRDGYIQLSFIAEDKIADCIRPCQAGECDGIPGVGCECYPCSSCEENKPTLPDLVVSRVGNTFLTPATTGSSATARIPICSSDEIEYNLCSQIVNQGGGNEKKYTIPDLAITIRNRGAATTGPFKLQVFKGTTLLQTFIVETLLETGETKTLYYKRPNSEVKIIKASASPSPTNICFRTPFPDFNTTDFAKWTDVGIRVVVNADGLINESNSTNNERVITACGEGL